MARLRARASPRGSRSTRTSYAERPSVNLRHARRGGRGRSFRLLRRLLGLVPDQQHLAIAVELRSGLGENLGERLIGPQLYLEDAPDGIACREDAAETGRDQQISDDDIGVVRQLRQAQAVAVAGAVGDRA